LISAGARSQIPLGELTALPPDSSLDFKVPTSKRRERRGKMKGKKREGKKKGYKRGWGKGEKDYPNSHFWLRQWQQVTAR